MVLHKLPVIGILKYNSGTPALGKDFTIYSISIQVFMLASLFWPNNQAASKIHD